MAGWFDSPSLFSGQAWSAWKGHLDKLSGLLVTEQDDRSTLNSTTTSIDVSKQPQQSFHSNTVLLKPDDAVIFGRFQTSPEESYLVVCDICGDILKPQALKRHLSEGHGNGRSDTKEVEKPSSLSIKQGSDDGKKSSQAPTVKSEIIDDDDDEDVGEEGDASMRSVMEQILQQPLQNQPHVVNKVNAQVTERRPEMLMVPGGNCQARLPYETPLCQEILPRNDKVPYYHIAGQPPQPVNGHFTSRVDIAIDFSKQNSTAASSRPIVILPNHRFDFARAALSRLVASLDQPSTDQLPRHDKNSSGDAMNGQTWGSSASKKLCFVVERLLSLVRPDAKRLALRQKLSSSLLQGLQRGDLTLSQLTARDRYILSRIYEIHVLGLVAPQSKPVNKHASKSSSIKNESSTTEENEHRPTTATTATITMPPPPSPPTRKPSQIQMKPEPSFPSPIRKNGLAAQAPPPSSSPAPPAFREISKDQFSGPPPPRPTILRGSSGSSGVKRPQQQQQPVVQQQQQQQQPQVVFLSSSPVKQAKLATSSPVQQTTVRLIAGHQSNNGNGNGHHLQQQQRHLTSAHQRQILPASSSSTATLDFSPQQQQQFIQIQTTSPNSKTSPTTTAFIAIANGFNDFNANSINHHAGNAVTMLTIPVQVLSSPTSSSSSASAQTISLISKNNRTPTTTSSTTASNKLLAPKKS